MNCIEIPIKDIIISENRRELKDITALAESIAQHGLINPITVTDSNCLVAGLHRLKACESLGWEKIPANILQLDEIEAEITEIDENMFRHELSALQRSDLLLRRKELYEARYPQTRHGRSKERIEAEVETQNLRLYCHHFQKTRRNRQTCLDALSEVEVAIAKNLSPEVKDMIRNTPLGRPKNRSSQALQATSGRTVRRRPDGSHPTGGQAIRDSKKQSR